jgi:hypothetical protein
MLTRFLRSQQSLAFYFWIVTAVLLLLYTWTLTETVPLAMEVREGVCTAVLSERRSEIPCVDLDEGEVGVYPTSTSPAQTLLYRPFDLLVPYADWDEVTLQAVGTDKAVALHNGRETNSGTIVTWPAPDARSYAVLGARKKA